MNKKFIAILVSVFAVCGMMAITGTAEANGNPQTINVGSLNSGSITATSSIMTIGDNDTGSSTINITFPATVTGINNGNYTLSVATTTSTVNGTSTGDVQSFSGALTINGNMVTLNGILTPGYGIDLDTYQGIHNVIAMAIDFESGDIVYVDKLVTESGTAYNIYELTAESITIDPNITTGSIISGILVYGDNATGSSTMNVTIPATVEGISDGTYALGAENVTSMTGSYTTPEEDFIGTLTISNSGKAATINGVMTPGFDTGSPDPYMGIHIIVSLGALFTNGTGSVTGYTDLLPTTTSIPYEITPVSYAFGGGVIKTNSIQSAVDAASNGDTINVAAGIYDEQIIINKELTLNGAGGSETKIIPASTTLAAIPSSEGIAGIIIVEGTTVNLSNLSVGGTNISELPEDAGAVAGIILNNATGTIRGVAVSDFPEPEEIDSIGIILSATTTNAFVTIDTCMILDYGTIGIALFGDKLTADIRNCNIGMGVVGVLADESIDAAKIKVNFNHISGNTDFGVGNENTSITLDATNNWWGDKSGPAHASNPDGIGNAVSDKVYYEPWLGAEVENIVTETKTDSTIDAKEEADTEIIVTGGTATVTVAKYSANPGTGFSGDIGKYIDVHLDSGSGATELEIRLHYTDADISGKDESTLKMYWWNGTNWSPCSDTGVNTSLNYIWAKISSTSTTPDLYFDKLAGTPFAGAGNAAPSYSSSMSGQFSPSVSYQNKPEEPEITIEELEARVAELRAMISELQLRLRSQQALAYQGIPANFTFKNDLKYGMTSDEVKHLQIILKTEIGSPTYPEDVPATGWFGPITKAAVIKFQEKYASEILAPWNLTTGTGLVGSTTRAKLNSLLK